LDRADTKAVIFEHVHNGAQAAGLHLFLASGELCLARPIVDHQMGGNTEQVKMNGIIYLVGLVVVILAVLSFFGLR
jgi:hypothetical protein